MSEGRFSVGDVVVLNGHRLTVELVGSNLRTEEPRVRLTAESGTPSQVMPADWLPDPEPREEPEPDYPPGSVWQDANGQVYRRTAHTPEPMWQGFGSGLQFFPDDYPARPLTRLVPEPGGPTTPALRGDEPDEVYYTPPDDHAGTYDDSEGDLEALARTVPALTPGQPVAHKDGRFGTYTAVGTGLAVSSALWRPFGELDSEYTAAADLRPVTLVERPDRDSALALMCPRIHSGRRDQVLSSDIAEDIYTALFGPGEPL